MRLDPSFKAQFISSRSSHDAINHITWPIRALDQENEDVGTQSVRHAQTWRIDTNLKTHFFWINPTKAPFYHQLFWKHPLLYKVDQDLIFTSSCSPHFSGHCHNTTYSLLSCCVSFIFFIFESSPFSADAPQDLPSKAANAASCQNKPRQKNRQAVEITSAKSSNCHDFKCFILGLYPQ